MSGPSRTWRRLRREWEARRRGGPVDQALLVAIVFAIAYATTFGVYRYCGGF